MSKTLNRNQLVEIRDALFDLITWSLYSRNALENQLIISKEESNHIGRYEQNLLLIAKELNSDILHQIIADIDDPGKKLLAVTKKMEVTISTLKSLNDFLEVLTTFISLAATVMAASTTGNPLVLVNILAQIEALSNRGRS